MSAQKSGHQENPWLPPFLTLLSKTPMMTYFIGSSSSSILRGRTLSLSISPFDLSVSVQDFDWDAAVREIDIACENSKPSTSTASVDPFRTPCFASSDALHRSSNAQFAADKRMNGAPRQSTLDKFIGRAGPRIELESRAVAIEDCGHLDSSGGMNCVEIDAEAANTWIYPGNAPGGHVDELHIICVVALFATLRKILVFLFVWVIKAAFFFSELES